MTAGGGGFATRSGREGSRGNSGENGGGSDDDDDDAQGKGTRQRQWAAFASGVAAQLGEEEQQERSRRRQWAAAAAQSEQARSQLLAELGPELERWASNEHIRLQPLQSQAWRALQAVAGAVQGLWGASARVELFGSWASGLQLPSSDVDLLVVGAPPSASAGAALRALAERLTSSGAIDAGSLRLIDTARVPVIKAHALLPADAACLCDGGVLHLDISLEGFGHHTGAASTQLTRAFIAQLPGLQPLVLLLKAMLASHQLNSASTGGLGSYALVLMATSLLQQQAATASHHAASRLGVGRLLVRFLEAFSALPETPDALHAVVLDSASRLQPKRVRRGQLLRSGQQLLRSGGGVGGGSVGGGGGGGGGGLGGGASGGGSSGGSGGSGAVDEGGGVGGRSGESSAGTEDALLYEEAVFASSLLVQDPLEPKFSNVTGVAFRWAVVQRLFRHALSRLQEGLEEGRPPSALLDELLGATGAALPELPL